MRSVLHDCRYVCCSENYFLFLYYIVFLCFAFSFCLTGLFFVFVFNLNLLCISWSVIKLTFSFLPPNLSNTPLKSSSSFPRKSLFYWKGPWFYKREGETTLNLIFQSVFWKSSLSKFLLEPIFWNTTMVFRFKNKQTKLETWNILVSDFHLSLWILKNNLNL